MQDEEKKIEFIIDTIDFTETFFKAPNLIQFKQNINDAKGIDRGAFEAFSENALSAIDFYLEESKPDEMSKNYLLNRLMQLCSIYENAPKKKSKKVAKVMSKLRENLLNVNSNKNIEN